MLSTYAFTVAALASSWAHAEGAAVVSTAGAGGAVPAAPVATLDEVVVTAERKGTNLEKTPVAISSVSADTLDKSFVNELAGLNGVVPSLEITKASGFENLVTIRGVGYATPENSPTNTPGVAEFVDGVYIANTISLDQTLFDVDHIEVLRGPQGALYGQSADGGAITILTKQPRLGVYDASGDFSVGDYSLFRERAEVNIPVGDKFAVRVSAQAYDHEGFTYNAAIPQNRLDDAHDVSGKVAVLWKPNNTFSATLTGMWYHADENGAAQKNLIEFSPAVQNSAAVQAECGGANLSSPRVVCQDYPATFNLTTQLYHLNLQWDLPWFVVKSVTAYQQLDHVQQEDSSRSSYAATAAYDVATGAGSTGFYDDVAGWNTHVASYTEEFDLQSRPGSRLDWTVGAFVMIQKVSQFVVEYAGSSAPPAFSQLTVTPTDETNPPANLEFGQLAIVNRQSYSGFAQGTYHVSPALRLTAGVRINHDSYTPAGYGFSGAVGGGPPSPSPDHADCPSSYSTCGYTDTVPTWRVEADYDLLPTSLVYASAARGYKPGGVNNNLDSVLVPHHFTYETNTAFEIGSKNTFLDNTVRLNLAAFYYDYSNMQYLEVDPFPFEFGTGNVPSIHIYGLEAETGYTSRDHRLNVQANLALENGQVASHYTSVNSTVINQTENTYSGGCYAGPYGYYYIANYSSCTAAVEAGAEQLKGKTPPDMPKVSGSVSVSYAFDLPYGVLTPRLQYVYRGAEWARIFNIKGLDSVDPYGVTNFYVEFVPVNAHYKFSLAVTNAFNVNGVNSRYIDPYGYNPYGTGQVSQQYIPPRQVIGTVAYAF